MQKFDQQYTRAANYSYSIGHHQSSHPSASFNRSKNTKSIITSIHHIAQQNEEDQQSFDHSTLQRLNQKLPMYTQMRKQTHPSDIQSQTSISFISDPNSARNLQSVSNNNISAYLASGLHTGREELQVSDSFSDRNNVQNYLSENLNRKGDTQESYINPPAISQSPYQYKSSGKVRDLSNRISQLYQRVREYQNEAQSQQLKAKSLSPSPDLQLCNASLNNQSLVNHYIQQNGCKYSTDIRGSLITIGPIQNQIEAHSKVKYINEGKNNKQNWDGQSSGNIRQDSQSSSPSKIRQDMQRSNPLVMQMLKQHMLKKQESKNSSPNRNRLEKQIPQMLAGDNSPSYSLQPQNTAREQYQQPQTQYKHILRGQNLQPTNQIHNFYSGVKIPQKFQKNIVEITSGTPLSGTISLNSCTEDELMATNFLGNTSSRQGSLPRLELNNYQLQFRDNEQLSSQKKESSNVFDRLIDDSEKRARNKMKGNQSKQNFKSVKSDKYQAKVQFERQLRSYNNAQSPKQQISLQKNYLPFPVKNNSSLPSSSRNTAQFYGEVGSYQGDSRDSLLNLQNTKESIIFNTSNEENTSRSNRFKHFKSQRGREILLRQSETKRGEEQNGQYFGRPRLSEGTMKIAKELEQRVNDQDSEYVWQSQLVQSKVINRETQEQQTWQNQEENERQIKTFSNRFQELAYRDRIATQKIQQTMQEDKQKQPKINKNRQSSKNIIHQHSDCSPIGMQCLLNFLIFSRDH